MRQKILYFCFLFLLFFNVIKAQNSPKFFKVFQVTQSGDPLWVQLMYSSNPNVFEVDNEYRKYYKVHEFKKTIHTQNYKHWRLQVQPYIQSDGRIVVPSATEQRHYWDLQKQNKLTNPNNLAKNTSVPWKNVGPYETFTKDGSLNKMASQSNVYCIASAPSNTSILYCLTEGGGLFKSTDKAQNWTLMSKNEIFTGGQDIAIHPTNPSILYIAFNSQVYKSTDGAITWTLSKTFTSTVEQILIKKNNPNTIFAATNAGLYVSNNAGSTWALTSITAWCWDIDANPLNPNTMYVATSNPTAKKAEVYKSTDGGATWVLKNSNWYTPAVLSQANDMGCKLSTTAADTNRVYAALIGDSKAGDNGWIGIYYSNNGANTWINSDGIDGGPYVTGYTPGTNWFFAGYDDGYQQGWYNFDMEASQINADKIWIGTIWLMESADKGASIDYIRSSRNLSSHSDVQDIEVIGSDVFVATDGGINYSNDELATCTVNNKGLTASEFWGFDQGWNQDVWVGGRYHNGDAAFYENYGTGNTVFLGGAESPTGHVNVFNNRKVYTNDAGAKELANSLNVPSTDIDNISIYPNSSYSALESSSLKYDYRYGNTVYLGNANILYKSTDGGVNFNALYTFPSGTTVRDFELSRSNYNFIYCVVDMGNSTSKIFKSTNSGTTFTSVTDVPSNSTSLIDLSLNPQNENNLYAIATYGNNGQKVYTTFNGGTTWINRTTSKLNGQQIYDVLFQAGTDSLVYLATNSNVWAYDKDSSNWINYGNGLPLVLQPLTFKPFYRDNKLRLSTNRGIWESPFWDKSKPLAQPMTLQKNVYCNRDTVQFDSYSVAEIDSTTQWKWSFSPAPAYISSPTVRNPKVIFSNSGDYNVTLQVKHGNDSSSKTEIAMIHLDNQCNVDSLPGMAMNCGLSDAQTSSFNINTNTFTISAWIKPKGYQNDFTGIVMNEDVSAGFNFNQNQLAFHWPSGPWWWLSGLTVDSNVWSHVAMVVEPTGITLYLNGIPSKYSYNVPVANITSLRIGSFKGWDGRLYNGDIDEVAFWNRSLSRNEIREIRHITRTLNDNYKDSLIAYYQFNELGSYAFNKLSLNHAKLSVNSSKVLSTAPVGYGEVSRLPVTSSSNVLFGNTGLSMTCQSTNPNGEIVVSRLHNLPDSLPNANPNIGSYWIINNYGSNTTFNPLQALNFSPYSAVFNSPIISTPNIAGLYKRSSNEHINNWVNLCGAANATTNWLTFNSSCNISGFSQFLITSSNNTNVINNINLPLKWLSFNVHYNKENDESELHWKTSNEENVKSFEIEKSSNVRDWTIIETVNAMNNAIENNYVTLDSSVSEGLTYYRIKQIDADGQFSYSDIRSIFKSNTQNEIVLYPNPSNGTVYLLNNNFDFRFSLYNQEGKLVKDIFIKENQKNIELGNLPNGVYKYTIVSSSKLQNGKILIIN